jgi:hypothetical protein
LLASEWHRRHQLESPSLVRGLLGNIAAALVAPQCRHRFGALDRWFVAGFGRSAMRHVSQ